MQAFTCILSLWELQRDVFSEKEHKNCGTCLKLIYLHLFIYSCQDIFQGGFGMDEMASRKPTKQLHSHCLEPTDLATCKEYACWKWAWH